MLGIGHYFYATSTIYPKNNIHNKNTNNNNDFPNAFFEILVFYSNLSICFNWI